MLNNVTRRHFFGLAAAPALVHAMPRAAKHGPSPQDGLTLVYANEFDTLPAIGTNPATHEFYWRKPEHTDGSGFGAALFVDPENPQGRPNPFVLENGTLVIEATLNPDGVWSSGYLSLGFPGGQGGRYFDPPFYVESSFSMPSGMTTFPPFWMLTEYGLFEPVNNNEIDIVVGLGQFVPNYRSGGHFYINGEDQTWNAIHPGTNDPGVFADGNGFDEFHTWGCRVGISQPFMAGQHTYDYYLDNVLVGQVASRQLPTGPTRFFPMLNLAMASDFANTTVIGTKFRMPIAFLRVWK
jgi:hypothetical protein